MKNNILKYFILLLSIFVVLTIYLSTVGIETDKFNDQIKKRILLINKKIDIDLNKVYGLMDNKFIFDMRNILDKNDEKDLINNLKDLNFTNKSSMAA